MKDTTLEGRAKTKNGVAMDSSDPRISDHGTWTVSAGWSEWRYGKDAKALSEN